MSGSSADEPTPEYRWSQQALAGFALGLASVCLCLNALAGIPAVLLGTLALIRIEREGPEKLRGRGLALAAFTLGGLGTLMTPLLVPPAIEAVRDASRRAQVEANLEQVKAAILAYQAGQGTASPAEARQQGPEKFRAGNR